MYCEACSLAHMNKAWSEKKWELGDRICCIQDEVQRIDMRMNHVYGNRVCRVNGEIWRIIPGLEHEIGRLEHVCQSTQCGNSVLGGESRKCKGELSE